MATAVFKSTTRRGPADADDAGSSTRLRRSRSLSRYSGRAPPPPDPGDQPAPRGRFVSTVRGSGFPEISLDDLADEFFRSKYEEAEEEERSPAVWERLGGRRMSKAGAGAAEGRRGRSVVRYNDGGAAGKKGVLENSGGSKVVSNGKVRRQRSVSVARHRCSDSENDLDFSHGSSSRAKSRGLGNGNILQPSFCRPTASSLLRKSASQKDLFQSHDHYSSHSSSLTDDDIRDAHATRHGTEKTIRAVHAQKMEHPIVDEEGSGLYEAMRKEVRHAVEDIRTELEKVMVKTEPISIADSDENELKGENVIQAIADIRKSYTSKLEQSEKRRQDLLAELAAEEQRGHELTKIVRELLPAPKQTTAPGRSSRCRRGSKDRNRMSTRLTEEAEKYIEDFLSNVEDTDISSYDGERSDTSSTLGGSTKLKDSLIHTVLEKPGSLTKADSLPAETDGVVLPWLQWETNNDTSPLPCKSNAERQVIPENNLPSPMQGMSAPSGSIDRIISSYGSWSPEGTGSCSAASRDITGGSRLGNMGSFLSCCSSGKPKGSSFNMDDYVHLQHSDDLLLEIWMQRQRIESGSLLICERTCI